MMNEFQRRVLAEAAKFGGKFVSNSEKIANKLNEAPAIGAGGMSGLFGYSKQQFEMKMRQLIQKMGFEKGITRMDITDRGMTLHFANAAKARDFVITFNGLTKRQSKGSAASISTSFDKAKAPMGSNAVVTVDFSMMKMEGIENPSHLFMVLEALHEEYVAEGRVKRAMQDWVEGLPKAVVAEIRRKYGAKLKAAEMKGLRQSDPVHKELKQLLDKNKVAPAMGDKSREYDIAALELMFDSFHGENVEESGEVLTEAFRFRQQDWEKMRAKYKSGTSVSITLKSGKTVSGTLLRMDKYDQGSATKGHLLHIKTSSGKVKIDDVDVKSIQWNNDPKTKMSEEVEVTEARKGVLPAGFKKGELLWLPGSNKRGQLVSWKPVDGVVGGIFTVVLPDKSVRRIIAQDIFRANSTKMLNPNKLRTVSVEEKEVNEQFKAGDKVKVPHKGKMVRGRIVRFDSGGTDKARQHGGGYVVDVGEPASILVPKQKVQKEEVDINEAPLSLNDFLDAIQDAYKKGGLKGIIQGGKQFGMRDRTSVSDVLANFDAMFSSPAWKRKNDYAAKEIKAFLNPQDYAKYKSKMESVEVEEVEIDEASWGGGFQSSREAQAGVQAGLKADAKKRQMLITSALQQVIDGKMSKAAFKKLTGHSYDEMMKLPFYSKKVKMKKEEVEDVEEAYAPLDTPNLVGAFTETTKKKRFEYRKSTNKWGISHGLPHEVCVKEISPSEWRAANVKGTVCYIATDEDEGGKPVIEKWAIRNHVKYVKAEETDREGEVIEEQDRTAVQGSKMVYVGQTLRALQSKSMFSGSVVKGERYKVATNKDGKVDLVHQSTGYRTAMRNVDVTTIEALIKNKVLI